MSANAEFLKSNRSRYSHLKGWYPKYKLSYQDSIDSSNNHTDHWLILENIMKTRYTDYDSFIDLLNKHKTILVKTGDSIKIRHDYTINKLLETLNLPTFMRYYSIVDCFNDDDFLLKGYTRFPYYLHNTNDIAILTIPYIVDTSIKDTDWTRDNFYILRNVFKHVVLSMFYAFDRIGFTHTNLHIDNVRLIKTDRKYIDYAEFGKLELYGIMPVIMDYDLSIIGSTNYNNFYTDDIFKYIYRTMTYIDRCFTTDGFSTLLYDMSRADKKPTPEDANDVLKTIDKFMAIYATQCRIATDPWFDDP
jgi:hypothetical protein